MAFVVAGFFFGQTSARRADWRTGTAYLLGDPQSGYPPDINTVIAGSGTGGALIRSGLEPAA
ncbi:MAG TPA: hypothetical protein VLA89_15690 [Gemmatimonadales bacterium]|nr:hypothetical protein [Gemmatimonadales bacterium]